MINHTRLSLIMIGLLATKTIGMCQNLELSSSETIKASLLALNQHALIAILTLVVLIALFTFLFIDGKKKKRDKNRPRDPL